ncbi:outer membrane beta-barrel protein [Desertivirga arenae]|uniref:outer membrane beta-barrel protein n=1 Tax=Desertivirga arenae TaxID=2810309 RepID=UPI001A968B72|nr:outer membrane beta-barrel protein [Pedobacter sp. SYSU D00823]
MKKTLFAALLALACTFTAKSQTKGTNAIGLGVSTEEYKDTYKGNSSSTTTNQKQNRYSLTYGYFFTDNARIKLSGFYGKQKFDQENSNYENSNSSFGGALALQKYYPLYKKFYAYTEGGLGYSQNRTKFVNFSDQQESKINLYSLNAGGGVAFFPFKHLALEANLLNASATYSKNSRDESPNRDFKGSSFNLSTSGSITNLGFNIYFLF